MLWLGIAGHIIGFDTVLMQAWRIREPVMWLCEKITGNRKLLGMNLVGGVRRDVPKEQHSELLEVIARVEKESKAVLEAIAGDTTLQARCEKVGVITPEDTIALALLGPTARASGIGIDIRIDHPYAAYPELGCEVMVEQGCDIWSRVLVRLRETLEAVRLIRDALSMMPDGSIMADMRQPIPAGRTGLSSVEAPRGETHHFVITGEDQRPYRWKARAPTFQNLQGIPVMVTGEYIADVPIGLGSMDPCFSCTERLETIDVRSGEVRIWSREELRELYRRRHGLKERL
ncbi:MAG TPA: hypothetical protein PKI90_07995 [bacterium]|nr:hypothetical protein [bacterium]